MLPKFSLLVLLAANALVLMALLPYPASSDRLVLEESGLVSWENDYDGDTMDGFVGVRDIYGVPIRLYELDLNLDGVYDVQSEHDRWIRSGFFENVALKPFLGGYDNGRYPVKVRATNAYGHRQEFSVQLIVGNVPPLIHAVGTEESVVGEEYELHLSCEDPGDDTVTHYTIDWGDGSISTVHGDVVTARHVYREAKISIFW